MLNDRHRGGIPFPGADHSVQSGLGVGKDGLDFGRVLAQGGAGYEVLDYEDERGRSYLVHFNGF
jgi:hypothetical protein